MAMWEACGVTSQSRLVVKLKRFVFKRRRH